MRYYPQILFRYLRVYFMRYICILFCLSTQSPPIVWACLLPAEIFNMEVWFIFSSSKNEMKKLWAKCTLYPNHDGQHVYYTPTMMGKKKKRQKLKKTHFYCNGGVWWCPRWPGFQLPTYGQKVEKNKNELCSQLRFFFLFFCICSPVTFCLAFSSFHSKKSPPSLPTE